MIVALRPLGLGDLLTAVPALRALRAAFGEHRIVLGAPRPLAPLARLSGAVGEVVHTEPLRPLPSALHGAHVAVDLHGRGPESHRVLLASRPRRLVAFRNPQIPQSDSMPLWRKNEHEVERWCRLLTESGVPADPHDVHIAPPDVPAADGSAGATVLHPGAASAARRWPADRFAVVARSELAAGRRVFVTGGSRERALALHVAASAGLDERYVLAGKTTLLELAALVAVAGRIVCGDTGIAHLATALGTPSVVLFGPTPPALWGPPADRPRHRALWAGSRGDPHGTEPDPGLLAIRTEHVLGALAELEREELAA
jgi:ADP-heptose:LPS heptosyltransferase